MPNPNQKAARPEALQKPERPARPEPLGESIQSRFSRWTGGRYREVKCLGSGGEGASILLEDREGREAVAKVYPRPLLLAEMEKKGKRLVNEARVLEQLDHPQIPKHREVIDLPDQGKFIAIRDYVEGKSLRQLIEERKTLPEAEVVKMLDEVLQVLEYLHDPAQHRNVPHPVLHRDLKPGNIVIAEKASVIDFGVAKSTDGNSTVTVKGTWRYMPREQLYEDQPSNDIYSLGVTAVECLLGGIPKELDWVMHGNMPYELPTNLGIPRKLRKILGRMVHPEKRYRSAKDVRAALRKAGLVSDDKGITVTHEEAAISKDAEKPTGIAGYIAGKAKAAALIGGAFLVPIFGAMPADAQKEVAKKALRMSGRPASERDVLVLSNKFSSVSAFTEVLLSGMFTVAGIATGNPVLLLGGIGVVLAFSRLLKTMIHSGADRERKPCGCYYLEVPYTIAKHALASAMDKRRELAERRKRPLLPGNIQNREPAEGSIGRSVLGRAKSLMRYSIYPAVGFLPKDAQIHIAKKMGDERLAEKFTNLSIGSEVLLAAAGAYLTFAVVSLSAAPAAAFATMFLIYDAAVRAVLKHEPDSAHPQPDPVIGSAVFGLPYYLIVRPGAFLFRKARKRLEEMRIKALPENRES